MIESKIEIYARRAQVDQAQRASATIGHDEILSTYVYPRLFTPIFFCSVTLTMMYIS